MSFALKLLLWFFSLDERDQMAILWLLASGWDLKFDDDIEPTIYKP